MTATTTVEDVALGLSVPPFTPHAISVSLPTWRDNVGYEEGDKRVVNAMVSGYPRFFISLSIQKLAKLCEQKYALNNEKCILLPSLKIAEHCRSYIEFRSAAVGKKYTARCIEERRNVYDYNDHDAETKSDKSISLHIVLFPTDVFSIAKEFWQHTGLGISSRFAERFLTLLEDAKSAVSAQQQQFGMCKMHNRHYSVKSGAAQVHGQTGGAVRRSLDRERQDLSPDHTTYLEERYGRNLPLSVAASAKRALRRRLAGVLIKDNGTTDDGDEPYLGQKNVALGPSSRGVKDVAEGDVYLLPTGMSAIWSTHQLLLGVGPKAKSVCFGFPYTDTLKILQKWGPGCYFFGNGIDGDIDELEKMLENEKTQRPHERPVLALFTEFPSNPLLRSANLPRLRGLADKYDFAIVVDETIGSMVNVEVLQYADIVVSSLTKIFSGDANVMGGSLVLNPHGKYYPLLKRQLDATFEDVYFGEDAIYLERNSRDFKRRVACINANTEMACDFLRSRSIAGGCTSERTVIKEVFYPKYITVDNYEHCRIKNKSSSASAGNENDGGGYGGLFSLTFTSRAASEAFFDALPCYKGPSLGTNFTLACPYTILAHFAELDWAAGYGVEAGLVRVSIGMEEREELLRCFQTALSAAEEADAQEKLALKQ
ncbi:hypothetical protein AX17_002522 [Amanita inopinata Kibby_2008]|nr:hypothetical protein AX17_002522 [Amanita inopinata Kibby_2008]